MGIAFGPLRERLRAALHDAVDRSLEASNRLRLPGASVLPLAGAVVGIYAGLAAGIFANLIGLVSGVVFGLPRVLALVDPRSGMLAAVRQAFAEAEWHLE